MASRNILVTGPAINEQAAQLAVSRGYAVAYVPPYTSEEDLIRTVTEVDPVGVIVRMGRFGAAAIDAAPSLRVLSKHGVGVDNIDVDAASRRDIPVVVAAGANALSVAEHAIALILASVKRIVPLDSGLRAGRWEKPGFAGKELAGMTVGLVGFGAIARQTAAFAQSLGMKVRAYDPFADENAFAYAGVARETDVDVLIAGSNIISLHCPLTPDTRKLLDDRRLGLMKPGSYVINTGRGGLIDEDALLRAIESGHIAGAGLDTFQTEPPAADHPFWNHQNIVVTPHIGGVTEEANARVGVEAVEGVLAVVEGRPLGRERIVNFRALANTPT
ncbi:hydroxyacid dehydrogenase [Sinorhizobium prairiense]|uniref:hydroxyacid dehydrogenase n=1 Tax=unclassified Sinorhizobium TaxID=2613772 RepID=UPI0023D87964|nr:MULTISPECIES: hydroxyacid dehydrogenase [unclassified Sinorhizobium]WEJ11529.1 hydroxyacid dehydrogenase [Sinorhizobium sp. M103]WEJ16756.1 hydroxyacid dehydrogenase [Sinorhizobium sp. K101]WEJ38521.1 hydroxyacid dehydrogenase [Sinorhizobium sp. C101]